MVNWESMAGPARGKRKVPIASFASVKRRSCKAHMPAIRAWISAGSEASVAGISEAMLSERGFWRVARSWTKNAVIR